MRMGRPSKLTEKQWAAVEKRLLAGESASALAAEFKVNRAAVSRRFSHSIKTVKAVANQLVASNEALRSLPVAQQITARTLADELIAISMHLAGAGKFGAATAHRLSGIAHAKVQEIDDAAPLDDKSFEALRGVAVLTKLANDSALIGIGLLAANKDMVKEINAGPAQSSADMLREIAAILPN